MLEASAASPLPRGCNDYSDIARVLVPSDGGGGRDLPVTAPWSIDGATVDVAHLRPWGEAPRVALLPKPCAP